jgi:dihydroflavonol-4-reductase
LIMVVVTGATGLVGSEVVRQLSNKGIAVKALYHSAPPFDCAHVEWVQVDILDYWALQDALQGAGQVYHCAALVSFRHSDKDLLQQINVNGTANVVNACLEQNVQQLLHVSSVAALTKKQGGKPIDEVMDSGNIADSSIYGTTKYLAEMEVWRGIGEGLGAVIVNPSLILGSGDWDKGSSAIFKNIYHEFPWYSQGTNGFVDVKDLAAAMIGLMESGVRNERFIVSAYNLSYKVLFDAVAKAFGRKAPHREVTPLLAALVWRLYAVRSFFTGKSSMVTRETAETALTTVQYDNSKLLKALPGFAYTPLETSLNRICTELRNKYGLG